MNLRSYALGVYNLPVFHPVRPIVKLIRYLPDPILAFGTVPLELLE